MEDLIAADPSELLETPKIQRKLPDTLSIHDIDKMIAAIDLSKPEGHATKLYWKYVRLRFAGI
jgi:integrase/recombinase XerD